MSVVCLGCSLTKGEGVEVDQSWPYILHEKMNVPVFNLGIGGSSVDSYMERLWLFKKEYNATYALVQITNPGRTQLGINGLNLIRNKQTLDDLGFEFKNIGNDYTYMVNTYKCLTRIQLRTSHAFITKSQIDDFFTDRFVKNGIVKTIDQIKDFLEFYCTDILTSQYQKSLWVKEMYTLQEFLKNEFEDYRMFIWKTQQSVTDPTQTMFVDILDTNKIIGNYNLENDKFTMKTWENTLPIGYMKQHLLDGGGHYDFELNTKFVNEYIIPEIDEWFK